MDKKLEVQWWDGSVVGHLIHRGPIYFVYDEDWIDKGHDLSPLSLPFVPEAYNGSKGVEGLPGLIADCLPDAWGQKIARREFAKNKWGNPTAMPLLAWRGSGGLGSLQFFPALTEESQSKKLQVIGAAALAKNAGEIERGEAKEVLPQLAKGGGTPGGALPKTLILYYPDGTLKVASPDGIGEPSILKFDQSPNNNKAPEEHLYAKMAKMAGIRTVSTKLISEDGASGRRHLLVKRFDVPDPKTPEKRLHFHTSSGMLHKDPGDMDYSDLYRTLIRLKSDPEELREITRRMIFNVLSSNHDDHGKNHAFAYDEESRGWALTPAYDMTYAEGILERGTCIVGEVWPSIKSMVSLCEQVGISNDEFMEIFEKVKQALDQWPDLAAQEKIPSAIIKEIQERHLTIQKRIQE